MKDQNDKRILERVQDIMPTVLMGRETKEHENGKRVFADPDRFASQRNRERTRANTSRLQSRVLELERKLEAAVAHNKPPRVPMTAGEVHDAIRALGPSMRECPITLNLGSGLYAEVLSVRWNEPHDDQQWYVELELGKVKGISLL